MEHCSRTAIPSAELKLRAGEAIGPVCISHLRSRSSPSLRQERNPRADGYNFSRLFARLRPSSMCGFDVERAFNYQQTLVDLFDIAQARISRYLPARDSSWMLKSLGRLGFLRVEREEKR